MDLHEYQSKQILKRYGVPVLAGYVAATSGEAERAFDLLAGPLAVVKAQILAGGRGKAGGVKLVRSATEARSVGEDLLGKTLFTPQTGAAGKQVRRLYIEAGCEIDKELYLSLILDRSDQSVAMIGSTEGGVDIEEVAEKHPEMIHKVSIDPIVGLRTFHTMDLGWRLGLSLPLIKELTSVVEGLYKFFIENDCLLLEINPLVITKQGKFVVLDCKASVDNNALFRHKELQQYVDYDDMDPKDLRASKSGLSYVALGGNIGCMVNGAGLAMSTMDIIKYCGGSPANFLDVGGGATKEKVTEAFRILLSDEKVNAILINIFGGIMRCDVIAQGVIEATKELGVKVPIVVRLQGTNVAEGKELLAKSGLALIAAESMDEAAEAVVKAAGGK